MYLCYDLKGIQSFIFSIPRLKYICGSSALIDRYDRVTAPGINDPEGEHLFSGGGKGAYKCTNDQAVERVRRKLVEAAHRDGLTICFGVSDDFTVAIHGADQTYPWLPSSIELGGKPCADSGLYPANNGVSDIVKKRVWQKGDRMDRYFEDELLGGVNGHGREGLKFSFFHDVDKSTPAGKIALQRLGGRNRWAVIAMDGNDIGTQHRKAVEKLGDRADVFTGWLRRMSRDLDTCSREACRKGIDLIIEEIRALKEGFDVDGGEIILPIRPLVVGGDDIILLCHVGYAMTFVREACRVFEEKSTELAALAKKGGIDLWPATGSHITLSAGILFAPIGLPLSTAISYTELLLASAKGGGREQKVFPTPSFVDWESVTEGLVDTPHARRQRELVFQDADLQNERIQLTERPYPVADLRDLIRLAQEYSKVPGSVRHRVLKGMRAGFFDRKIFAKSLAKNQEVLSNDLDEGESPQKPGGKWKKSVKNGHNVRTTPVIDALLLLEEDSRMNWVTEVNS